MILLLDLERPEPVEWPLLALGLLAILFGLLFPFGQLIGPLTNLSPDGELGPTVTRGLELAGFGIAAIGALLAALGLLWTRIGRAAQAILTMPRRYYLIGLIALALLLRLIWVLVVPTAPFTDYAVYDGLARNLAAGKGYYNDFSVPGEVDYHTFAFRPPGWPLLLAAVYLITGPSLAVAKALTLILSVLVVWLGYELVRGLANERVARLSGLLLALFPSLIAYTSILASEWLFTVLILPIFIILIGKPEMWTLPRVIAAGALFGAALLTRPIVQFWPVVILAYVLYRTRSIWLTLRLGVIFALAAAVVVLPWSFRNQRVLGQFVLVATNGGDTFVESTDPTCAGMTCLRLNMESAEMTELELSELGYQQGWANIKADPGGYIAYGFVKLQRLYLFDYEAVVQALEPLTTGEAVSPMVRFTLMGVSEVYYLAIFALTLIGLVNFPLYRREPGRLLIVGTLAYLTAIHFVFHGESRFHFPMLPLVMPFAVTALLGLLALRAWVRVVPVPAAPLAERAG
jgi:4-amino-4-deoxy-L-arabinose transferase-like glycosyltransferase